MTRTIFDKAAVSVALAVMAASLERDVVVRQALPTRLVILRAAERAAGGRIGPVVEASLLQGGELILPLLVKGEANLLRHDLDRLAHLAAIGVQHRLPVLAENGLLQPHLAALQQRNVAIVLPLA